MAELPVCTICNFSPIVVSDKYVMHDDSKRCPLSSAEDMTPEQWIKLMGQGEAVGWMDDEGSLHATIESATFRRRPVTALYTRPAPAADDAVLRKHEKRIASPEWLAEFFRFAPDGAWNNFNNWILNDYCKAGISGKQAASHFYSMEL